MVVSVSQAMSRGFWYNVNIMKKLTLLAVVAAALAVHAKIDMGTPFTDGVVLQRDRAVPVWGKAQANTKVIVEFAGVEVSTRALSDGSWKVELPAMKASKENRIMRVSEEGGEKIELKDVLVGEVWMCSGQSNTDCPIWANGPRYRDGSGAMMLLSTYKPFVRLVKTPHVASVTPRRGYKATWMSMTPDMYDAFKKGVRLPSAMGYYFALELANALDIPVGLVDSSWGGTNIDAWTPPSGYEKRMELADVAALPRLNKDDFGVARSNGVYKGKNIYRGWHQQPTLLWNGMVAAYAPMACRGFIWYQGCTNGGEPERYASKMHALYDGWAKEFKNPSLKLYFVQLAPYVHNWTGICAAQNKFADEEKNAGIAVISDVGNFWDIHPNDKRTVGKRLSLLALKRDYGCERIKAESPVFRSVKFTDNTAEMTFDNVENWYVYADDRSVEPAFEMAGADGKWHHAKLKNVDGSGNVKGKTLVVVCDKVAKPVQVRYMYKNQTSGTLYNEGNLPLGPFLGK